MGAGYTDPCDIVCLLVSERERERELVRERGKKILTRRSSKFVDQLQLLLWRKTSLEEIVANEKSSPCLKKKTKCFLVDPLGKIFM